VAGYPVAQAFAGHSAPSVTGRYMKVNITEIAAAVAILTSESHPLSPAEAATTTTLRPTCHRPARR
jgi:hypothetical protein